MEGQVFNVGQQVRSYDWQPLPGRGPCFIEGEILEVKADVGIYVIKVSRDVWLGAEAKPHGRIGEKVYVPMALLVGEFAGRLMPIEVGEKKQQAVVSS